MPAKKKPPARKPPAVKYLETPEPAPNRRTLKLKTEYSGLDDVFTWTCPRCKHASRESMPRRSRVGGLEKAAGRGRSLPGSAQEAAKSSIRITLQCHCHQDHEEKDVPGCGHYFKVGVKQPQ